MPVSCASFVDDGSFDISGPHWNSGWTAITLSALRKTSCGDYGCFYDVTWCSVRAGRGNEVRNQLCKGTSPAKHAMSTSLSLSKHQPLSANSLFSIETIIVLSADRNHSLDRCEHWLPSIPLGRLSRHVFSIIQRKVELLESLLESSRICIFFRFRLRAVSPVRSLLQP